jgi:hypothetical protein
MTACTRQSSDYNPTSYKGSKVGHQLRSLKLALKANALEMYATVVNLNVREQLNTLHAFIRVV